MPWSHSVATPVVAALAVRLVSEKGFGRAPLGRALGIGIVSHLILDLLMHAHDIALWPGLESPKLGSGLYDIPFTAFMVELVYGIACWAIYRGSRNIGSCWSRNEGSGEVATRCSKTRNAPDKTRDPRIDDIGSSMSRWMLPAQPILSFASASRAISRTPSTTNCRFRHRCGCGLNCRRAGPCALPPGPRRIASRICPDLISDMHRCGARLLWSWHLEKVACRLWNGEAANCEDQIHCKQE
jgi:hypothetical protein